MELKPGYKRTEVGVIPEDWEVKPLGSILKKGRLGGNYPNRNEKTEFPLMKMGNIARGYFDISKVEFIEKGVRPEAEHKLVRGDVLFNTRNTLELVGKVALWRDELPVAYYNSNLMRFEFDPQEVSSSEYASSYLNTTGSVARLRALATGTTSVAAIYTRDLMSFPFVVAPLPEQRAIAAVLSGVDALIASLDRLFAKKRDLKQAAMQELLTGKRRLPGFSGEWEVKRLGDVVDKIIGGGTPSRSNSAYWGNEIPWVTVKDFATFNPVSAQEAITKEGLKNSSSNLIPKGTLITSTRMALGKAVIYEVDVSINQDLKAIFPRQDISSEFLYFWFQAHAEHIENLGSGSTVMGISLIDLKNIAFNKPPFLEQTAIAAILSDMDTEIATLEQKLDKTRLLKQGMMQELLTGRIRLV